MNVKTLQSALHRAQIALDKLPPGAVILDHYGHAWQKGGDYRFTGNASAYWYRAYGNTSEVSSFELAQCGPVTVMEAKP